METNKLKYIGLCHNDLHKGNILVKYDYNISIIDHDYTAFGDIFYDLATLCYSLELNNIQTNNLLELYFGELNEEYVTRLQLYIFVVCFWNSMWYFSKKYIKEGNDALKKFNKLIKAHSIMIE